MVGRMNYGNGAVTTYWHDSLDRMTHLRKQSSSTGAAQDYYYVYNANGLLGLKKDLVSNIRTRYTYDTAGRLISLRETSGTDADGGAQKYAETYTYEAKTNRISKYRLTFDGTESYLFTYRYGSVVGGEISDAVYGVSFGGIERYSHYYDTLGRKTRDTINTGTVSVPTNYTYVSGSKTNSTTSLLNTVSVNGTTWKYEYDDNGNITKIYKNNVLEKEYTYDALGQLTKEVDKTFNRTTTYTYDKQGNILKAAATGTGAATHTYTYGDSGWKDLLTAYDGQSISYDTIGNPLTYRDGMAFTWQNGRELKEYRQNGTLKATYTYDDNGFRTSKTVNGYKNTISLSNGMVVRESPVNGTYLTYLYDDAGTRYAIRMRNASGVAYFYYLYNGQGDVTALIDSAGTTVASYEYDAFGKVLAVRDASGAILTDTTKIGHLNPFRYRGYYYDTESGLYYLQSRYYDPQTGRFINADKLIDNRYILGSNIFAYCQNNPVMYQDPLGESLIAAFLLGVGVTLMIFGLSSDNAQTPQVSLSSSNDLPFQGTPGSHVKSPDGTKERIYGPDGLPDRDRHHTDHGNPKKHPDVPHDHDWGYNKEGKWEPGKGYKSPDGPLQPRKKKEPAPEYVITLPDLSQFSPSTGDETFAGKFRDFIEIFF